MRIGVLACAWLAIAGCGDGPTSSDAAGHGDMASSSDLSGADLTGSNADLTNPTTDDMAGGPRLDFPFKTVDLTGSTVGGVMVGLLEEPSNMVMSDGNGDVMISVPKNQPATVFGTKTGYVK